MTSGTDSSTAALAAFALEVEMCTSGKVAADVEPTFAFNDF